MRTVDYSQVLRETCDAVGLDYDHLNSSDATRIRGFIQQRLKTAWKFQFWPDLMRVEKRFFRQDWNSGTSYSALNEVYYPKSDKYYVSLKNSNLNNAPATGTDLAVNSAWWGELKTSYDAADYDSTQSYVAGDQVYYPDNGKYYQCHTASTGNAPTNTSFWGELPLFDRYVAYEQSWETNKLGDVVHVWNRDPFIYENATNVEWGLSRNGVQVLDSVTKVWIEYRQREPVLKGDAYDSTKAYATGDQIRFDNNGISNFYDCVSATTAGQSPATHPSKWSIVEIPLIFETWLAQGAAGDWLRAEGQESVREDAIAQLALESESGVLLMQSGQGERVTIGTR